MIVACFEPESVVVETPSGRVTILFAGSACLRSSMQSAMVRAMVKSFLTCRQVTSPTPLLVAKAEQEGLSEPPARTIGTQSNDEYLLQQLTVR